MNDTDNNNTGKTIDKNYYAETAYTDAKMDIPDYPVDTDNYNYIEQQHRKYAMPIGKFCGHIMPRFGKQAITYFWLYGEEKFTKQFSDRKPWEELKWATLRNPKAVWSAITSVALLLTVITFLATLYVLLAQYDRIVNEEPGILWFIIGIMLFYLFARYKKKTSDNINNIIFNRRTGMISIPCKGQEPFVRPFDEFIPYYTYKTEPHSAIWFLYLAHKNESIGALEPTGSPDPRSAFADWTLIQWYMDKNLPLPDIAEFEIYRHRDPTTATYDKKTGRPARYWRDMNYHKANQLYSDEIDKLDQFDVHDPDSWQTVPDDYFQWPNLVKLEPAEGTYDTDE